MPGIIQITVNHKLFRSLNFLSQIFCKNPVPSLEMPTISVMSVTLLEMLAVQVSV